MVHGNSKSTGWWYHASNEERLAQIDGCIDVGMTGPQCAMNCGAEGTSLQSFAARHGRHFDIGIYSATRAQSCFRGGMGTARINSVKRAKKAYLAGEPVDFWGAE